MTDFKTDEQWAVELAKSVKVLGLNVFESDFVPVVRQIKAQAIGEYQAKLLGAG